MPRPPTKPHVVRKILEIIRPDGWSQKRLAESIGMAPVTLRKKIEGSNPLTDSEARRIHALTGASIEELKRGAKGRALDLLGRPYSLNFFKKWRKGRGNASDAQAAAFGEKLGWWAGILLRAAETTHGGNRIHAVVDTLTSALGDAASEMKLTPACRRLATEEFKAAGLQPHTWGAWHLTPSYLKRLDDECAREMNEEAVYQVEREAKMQAIIEAGRRESRQAAQAEKLKKFGIPSYVNEILTPTAIEQIGDEKGLPKLAGELEKIAQLLRHAFKSGPRNRANRSRAV